MRIPSIPTLIRTLHTLSFANNTLRTAPTICFQSFYQAPHRVTVLRSMPSIPFLGALFGTNSNKMADEKFPVQKTEGEWQAILSPEQFRILRKKGTEMAGTGKYDRHYPDTGVYNCAGCDTPLYKAQHKFKSGCGWPAFWDAFPGAVVERDDKSLGMVRTEILCAHCGGHLGHIFKGERFGNPKDNRHCVNSVSINFSPEEK
ncbi:SelR-domain-containing protein [Zopfia rhizophila CBS 207.26]|uniref:Peptide-methionine (R)-S-oxide reductase n=1 Tax=Zopfia rhizophila CBS 207.26 TaxID=1314779 RepID=A0A6A6DTR1_9PEZI|nr:SelR-domain-containing protein [Zopfia rhizophila CBS 207.26]